MDLPTHLCTLYADRWSEYKEHTKKTETNTWNPKKKSIIRKKWKTNTFNLFHILDIFDQILTPSHLKT